MQIEKQQIVNWLSLCAKAYDENKDFLTDLDRDLGDSDHGLHINRGFKIVSDNLPTLEKQNISTILKNTGMILLYNVGGASGPLYGTLFIRAAAAVGTREQISFEELIESLKSGVDGIVARGKANVGDKTMCDVWLPVIEQTRSKIASGANIDSLLECMVSTAEKGAVSTIEMQASKGGARILGKQSVGYQDPGATSSLIMIKALAQAMN
ncbi:dihydroxyacetone kinase ADP-binding subunit DhaL [Vibrio breoganii]|uniref:dihydroxyacetone kinase subunit DhaL n=1 Tax=Vibrio breoganii TaxID=553239 RepID=UPI000C83BC7B|nr:dihydroxyacetone kinase subunit DhaL [Vibrio breoganii]PML93791.1 dihydroxyacetone kinase subunit L [Vibrio breoganii]PMN60841.1 dihydroxyacetone kinase subunit L [Vibrio breoganii]PMO59572.1 dihydroxyacetone kinase subunit L [Vibrio breoganii]TKF86533.1 dihydroxyacetone kinase ADP-binding subunit DhaL [Vibrio breoganii]